MDFIPASGEFSLIIGLSRAFLGNIETIATFLCSELRNKVCQLKHFIYYVGNTHISKY